MLGLGRGAQPLTFLLMYDVIKEIANLNQDGIYFDIQIRVFLQYKSVAMKLLGGCYPDIHFRVP